ncbi:Ig-like domain-containing protein [Ruania suaedae]|uniref:Ig-like domain-containing protein n=1 Tax=Ruania suaedae TaxID=2897774 RepID=UPI001E5CC261|nr:Ig-like domain-containing protein [Ruania suaedae]UFU03244.1 Ig-like domain-containing protein [Ruania suaedae]
MKLPTGSLRAWGAGLAGLALVAAGLGAGIGGESASADTAADGAAVGEPRPVLIESAHAAGKTAVIGAQGLPLFTRTIATEPEALTAQAVVMYSVAGAPDTVVLTSAAGDVLARAEGSRALELLDLTPAAAAAEDLATWSITTRGDRSMLINSRPLNGNDAALNLYDWNTADGAQVGTWDAGDFGGNESWYIHPVQATTDGIGGLVIPGSVPDLPSAVTAAYGWGPTAEVSDIRWEMPEDEVWETEGVVEFSGYGDGLFGDTVRVEARFTVGTVGDALESELTSFAGVRLDALRSLAPRTVERSVSGSDMTVEAPVRWDWDAIDPEALTGVGEFTVPAVADLGFAASLRVTLTPPSEVNVLRAGGVRSWRFAGEEDLSGLTDGNREAEAFGDWRSGGASNRVNPNWVAYYFERPTQVDGAALYEFSGADNIGAVTFQWRNMRGGWEDVSVGTLTNDGGRLQLETDFDAVTATGFRAVFEHKSDASWMQLAEFEVWGPGL